MRFADLPQDVKSRLNILGLERLGAFRFAVQIDGFLSPSSVVGFERVEDFGASLTVREVKEGGHPGTYRFPRRSHNDSFTLVRGMTFSRDPFNWFQSVANWGRSAQDTDYRRTLSIFMLDDIAVAGHLLPYEVWRWDVRGAWPSEWRGPRLNALKDEQAFEAITIHHEGITEAQGLFSGRTGDVLSLLT